MPDHNQLFLLGFMFAGGEVSFGGNGFPGESGEAVFGYIPFTECRYAAIAKRFDLAG